jgi:hypothetical protein
MRLGGEFDVGGDGDDPRGDLEKQRDAATV